MDNTTDITRSHKIRSFKRTWKLLSAEQRVSLSMLLVLLVAIPVGVLISLSPTRLFSRAYLPTTPPVTPPTNTPMITLVVTPTPSSVILLNSSTGKSCTTICQELALNCTNVGTDIIATNGKSWQSYKNSCAEIVTTCDGKMKKTSGKSCLGNTQPWTNCACN